MSPFEYYKQTLADLRNNKFDIRWIEKICAFLLYALKILTPWFWLSIVVERRLWYEWRNTVIDIYLGIKLMTITFLLYGFGWVNTYVAIILGSYMLFDITQYFLGLVFLSDVNSKTLSLKKNFAHLIINVLEISGSFAVLYLYTQSIFVWSVPLHTGLQAIYFSMITFATIGYGDIHPWNTLGQRLVIFQTFISFIFITIIVSSFVANKTIHQDEQATQLK